MVTTHPPRSHAEAERPEFLTWPAPRKLIHYSLVVLHDPAY